MHFLDKFMVFSASFVFGMVIISAIVVHNPDKSYFLNHNQEVSDIPQGTISGLDSDKLECNAKTDPNLIIIQDLSEYIPQNNLVYVNKIRQPKDLDFSNSVQGY